MDSGTDVSYFSALSPTPPEPVRWVHFGYLVSHSTFPSVYLTSQLAAPFWHRLPLEFVDNNSSQDSH